MGEKDRPAQPNKLSEVYMKTETGKKDLIYLYCVTNNVPKLKEVENLVEVLYFIYHHGIYAVAGKVSEDEFSEENLKRNLANLEWIKTKASIHEKIIEGIMKNSCVIPFKFATLFNTEDNLKTMLEEHIRKFKDSLEYLEGKEEWGVKIYCDVERLKDSLIRNDEEILKIDKEIESSSPGKAFLLKKKREELLITLINKKLNEYGQTSFDELRELSLKARINKLLPKEVTERKDDMILNSAFLVEKNKVSDFMHILYALRAQYEDRGLFFDCTGPWPPYNFCSIDKEEAI